MASARSFNLSLQGGDGIPIELGSQLQVRGIKQQDSIIYPRFTGVSIEDSTVPVVINDGESRLLFEEATQTPGSIISDNVNRTTTGVSFPYLSSIAVKFHIAYRVISGTPTIEVEYLTAAQAVPSTFLETISLDGTGVIKIEFHIYADTVAFQGINLSGGSIEILRNLSEDPTQPSETFVEMVSLGRLNNQL